MTPASQKLRRPPAGLARLAGAAPPPGYGTLAENARRLMHLTEKGAGRLFVLGHSVRGRPLWGVHLGPPQGKAPQVMIQAQIHGNEWIGTELCLALLEHLGQHGPPRKTGLWVLPILNPDGYERTLRRVQHAVAALGRRNANGVDLNRNWPVGFYNKGGGFFSGSRSGLSPYYRGPYPLSEPETRTLARVVKEENIRASVSLHAYGAFVGYPPCHLTGPTPDHALFEHWAGQMTSAQPRPYRHDTEVNFYPAFGDFDDWFYYEHGGLPFLVEVGEMGLNLNDPRTWFQPFYWFNPPDVAREVDNVLPLLLRFLELSQDHDLLDAQGPGPQRKGLRF